ncbi:BTBD9 family protein [Megaselia abdita]
MYFCEIVADENSFNGFSKLLHSEKFSDITFSVEGKKIPTHKAILAIRCEYFSTMFDSGLMKESKDNLVKLDVPMKEFNSILEYIYTGYFKAHDEEEVLQVLSLSQEYLLTNLFKNIEEKLQPKITLENVFKIVKISKLLGLDSVFENGCKFINRNLITVLKSPRLNELTIKSWEYILDLHNEENTQRISEINIFSSMVKWTEQNGGNIDKDRIQIMFSKLRLDLMSVTDLITTVRKLKIYDADFLMDAIEKKCSAYKTSCNYCGNPWK